MSNNDSASRDLKDAIDVGEFLWIVLANVSNGDWTKQSEEWQKAAAKARDDFHSVAKRLNVKVA